MPTAGGSQVKHRLSLFSYWMTVRITSVVARVLVSFEVVHRERVPREGPVVLYANHLNLFDPPLVGAALPRRARPMAKRELFETPLIGWVFWAYGAFPVRRYSADIGALRAGRNLLRNGDAVLVFPEGTRSRSQQLRPALPGASMMALLAGAEVQPVAITGSEQLHFRRALWGRLRRRPIRVRIEFGEPFALPAGAMNGDHVEQAADLMMRRLAAMLPESYRGAYGPGSEGAVVVARQEQPNRASAAPAPR